MYGKHMPTVGRPAWQLWVKEIVAIPHKKFQETFSLGYTQNT